MDLDQCETREGGNQVAKSLAPSHGPLTILLKKACVLVSKPAFQSTPPLPSSSGSKSPPSNISPLSSLHFLLPLMRTSTFVGLCLSNKLLTPYFLSQVLFSRRIKLWLWPAMPWVPMEQEVVQVVSSDKVLFFPLVFFFFTRQTIVYWRTDL